MENMEAFGVPRRIVAFVIPTGYSFNLDGSTLYLSLAAIFVAQAAGIQMSIGQQFLLLLTLMLTSKGVAGVPRAALVILLGTVSSFNLPAEPVFIILGIDALMDMARTATNVLGNCLATVVIARWEGESVFNHEAHENREGLETANVFVDLRFLRDLRGYSRRFDIQHALALEAGVPRAAMACELEADDTVPLTASGRQPPPTRGWSSPPMTNHRRRDHRVPLPGIYRVIGSDPGACGSAAVPCGREAAGRCARTEGSGQTASTAPRHIRPAAVPECSQRPSR